MQGFGLFLLSVDNAGKNQKQCEQNIATHHFTLRAHDGTGDLPRPQAPAFEVALVRES